MVARALPRTIAARGVYRSYLIAGAAVAAVATAAAIVTGTWPVPALAGLVGVAILGLLLFRLDLAVAVLAAGFFFNNYLNRGAGIITIDKLLGALAVGAWVLQWVLNRRPVLMTRQMWLVIAFLLWTGVSFLEVENDHAALVTSLRYLTFGVLFFLVLQTVRGDRRRADALVNVVVGAAAIASVIGFTAFLRHHVVQASGPLKDPNDFGFMLASTVPLAIYQVGWKSGWRAKVGWGAALVMILVSTFATFSRSALTGLAVAAAWALVTRRLRLRWLLTGAVCVALAAGGVVLAKPQLLKSALGERAHVATANVNERIGYYHVEVTEWEHFPVTGVGPGNFVYRFFQYENGAREALPYPSNVLTISGEEAYLVILAEQGGVGLAIFLCYLALSWRDLRRRFPGDLRADQLQAALAGGFVVAVVGALFLAEQYYPPLWFLPAMGATLAAGQRLLADPAPGGAA